MSDELRVIFAGTPGFAAHHLDVLLSARHRVVGVFTQPDRPAGRGNKLSPSPVKVLAERNSIPVFQPATLRSEESQQLIAALDADIMIVVAYGLILPQTVLTLPRLGCINVHGSLLPRWRGAAPIQRALWAGDRQSGITIMQMDSGLDSGAMLYKVACDITPADTSATLYDKLARLGPDALLKTLERLIKGALCPEAQDGRLATYAQKLSKQEAKLDWSLSAVQLERCIRAFNPWPVSYVTIEQQPVKIWRAQVLSAASHAPPGCIIHADNNGIQVATTDGVLSITQLQPAGKKTMSVSDLLNSRREWFVPGKQLT